MIIHGFQKMTLLDFPTKVACTIFTAACNFRCPFCHNASLVTHLQKDARLEEADILAYLKKRQGLLDGVCITGGEPTLQDDLPDFICQIKALGYAVKLDTNGSRPDVLAELLAHGLVDYVAMDVKNAPEKYAATVGLADFDLAPIQKSIELLHAGQVEYEFRTTVTHELHTPDDIEALCRYIAPAPRYFLQPFVDSGDLIGQDLHAPDPEILAQMLERATGILPSAGLRGA